MNITIDDINNELVELENEYKLLPSSQLKAKIDRLKKELWALEEKLQKDKNDFYIKFEEDKRKNDENKKTNKPKRYK